MAMSEATILTCDSDRCERRLVHPGDRGATVTAAKSLGWTIGGSSSAIYDREPDQCPDCVAGMPTAAER